jgi:hypothetical protein
VIAGRGTVRVLPTARPGAPRRRNLSGGRRHPGSLRQPLRGERRLDAGPQRRCRMRTENGHAGGSIAPPGAGWGSLLSDANRPMRPTSVTKSPLLCQLS